MISSMRDSTARAKAQTVDEWMKEYSTGEIVAPSAWQGDTKPFNHMTILPDGSGQITGEVAEIRFAQGLERHSINYQAVGKQKGPYDFICTSAKGEQITIDVKAKQRNVKALPNYDAHVTCDQMHYDCRLYVFASVCGDLVQFMGWCGKQEFWDNCRIVSKNEKDGSFNFYEKTDAGKLEYSKLRTMQSLVKFLL